MSEITINPEIAQNYVSEILKFINEDEENIVKIIGENHNKNAVIISEGLWSSIQETLYLEKTGTLNVVRERKNERNE